MYDIVHTTTNFVLSNNEDVHVGPKK